mmetsp:Transcript_11599/g.20985  ORF Transcript_11599/g.20985 Transcript_11599/m.20985 type:complete len:216 (-) Transcript_11599:29-676(-)
MMDNDDALLALVYGQCDAQAGDSTRRLQTGSTGSTLIHKPETQPNRNGRSSKAFSIVENEMLGARPEFLRNLQLNDTDSPSSSPLSPDTTSLKLKSPKKQSMGTPRSRGITKKPKKFSAYCHLCSRPTWRAQVARCTTPNCCKSVCEECFEKYEWDFSSVVESEYVCSHCISGCPVASRCHLYQSMNQKRKEERRLNRLQALQILANDDVNSKNK